MTEARKVWDLLRGGEELLERMRPLWCELQRHHADRFPKWREDLLAATFDQRKAGLIKKGVGGLLVLLAMRGREDVAYGICTVNEHGQGEIDSIYVSEEYRQQGIGTALMKEAMAWLRDRNVTDIVVDVMAGNDAAAHLYEKFGFAPRTVRMKHVPEAKTCD